MEGELRVPHAGGTPISEWHPDEKSVIAWSIIAAPLTVVALLGYLLIALRGELPTQGTFDIPSIVLVLALTIGLAWVHEGVHGLVMMRYGVVPEFGILKIGGIFVGFYTTAPGHRFSRRPYLAICLAPLVVITPLGIVACMLPFGALMVVPFGLVFGGCIGDLTIAWHVLRGPNDVLCEDLRDGLRLWPTEG
jgi:hypothetical protein